MRIKVFVTQRDPSHQCRSLTHAKENPYFSSIFFHSFIFADPVPLTLSTIRPNSLQIRGPNITIPKYTCVWGFAASLINLSTDKNPASCLLYEHWHRLELADTHLLFETDFQWITLSSISTKEYQPITLIRSVPQIISYHSHNLGRENPSLLPSQPLVSVPTNSNCL